MNPKSIDRIVSTVTEIVKSPGVVRYNVGITNNSKRRRRTYASIPPHYRHYVILETGLSAKTALQYEKYVFIKLTKKDIQSDNYIKYRHDSRDKEPVPSLGGLIKENNHKYDLYISWRSQ